jgi:hypothetical protein
MGKTYPEIPEDLKKFIKKQHMFFVATAPLGAEGHINVSPKGYTGTLSILNSNEVRRLDPP